SQVPFPVYISIRAEYQPNEMVKRFLSNIELETKDQREEAIKGEQNIDETVEKVESGARSLKSHFQQTGDTAFSCNIVFKVTAETKDLLNERVYFLVIVLTRFRISVVPLYGDQVHLLFSTIPSYKSVSNDYKKQVITYVLADIMFGATTNILDNIQFYIRHTKHFST